MKIYQQDQNNYSIGKRIKSELSLLCLLLLLIFFFVGFNFVYFSATFLMYTLLLLLKRNRIITSVHISENKIILHYYYLLFFKGKKEIPISKLKTKISMKRYGFGSSTKTLEFFKKKILVGEIRTNGKWKWKEDKMDELYQRLLELNVDL